MVWRRSVCAKVLNEIFFFNKKIEVNRVGIEFKFKEDLFWYYNKIIICLKQVRFQTRFPRNCDIWATGRLDQFGSSFRGANPPPNQDLAGFRVEHLLLTTQALNRLTVNLGLINYVGWLVQEDIPNWCRQVQNFRFFI